MTYNILFIKNRFKKRLKINKYAIDWFKEHTPLEIVIDETTTDFDLSFIPTMNETVSGVIVGGDIIEKLKTVVPQNKYHCVVFLYGNKAPKVRLDAANKPSPLYENTEFIQLVRTTDNGKTLNHELFHTFIDKAKRKGANIIDVMDTYYRDNIFTLLNGETNRTLALKTLSPHWDKVTSLSTKPVQPTVILTRTKDTSKQVTGLLEAYRDNQSYTCKTLELPDLNNLPNISCIPKGTYTCKYTFSPRFRKYTYEVLSVPKRSGIRIHSANYYHQLNGCIALGTVLTDANGDGMLDTINSRIAINTFEAFMKKEPFTLIVK